MNLCWTSLHWNCSVLGHWPFKCKGTLEWSQCTRTVFQMFLKDSSPAKVTAVFPGSHWWILMQLEAFCLLLFFHALSLIMVDLRFDPCSSLFLMAEGCVFGSVLSGADSSQAATLKQLQGSRAKHSP